MENQTDFVQQAPEKTGEELMKEFMDIVHTFKGPIRQEGEEFEDYRIRLAKENAVLKAYQKGKVVWAGGTYSRVLHGELK